MLLAQVCLVGCAAAAPPVGLAPDAAESAPAVAADGGALARDARLIPDAAPIALDSAAPDAGPDGLAGRRPGAAPPVLAACSRPPCMNVYNNCSFPIWIHPIASIPIDDGLVRPLAPGAQRQYAALPDFAGGRLYAYYQEPAGKQDRIRLLSDYNQFVEMTVDHDPATGALAQNYNISYVDYLALPVSMKAVGAKCSETVCGAGIADWTARLRSCPTELRNQAGGVGTCMGSYNYCITADGEATYDTTRPYCKKMQDAHGYPGSAVYGGTFADHPAQDVRFWDGVAGWNRGVAAGDAVDSNYYRTEPYNQYARWVHEELGCRNVYAFSTDDHQDKAGFVRCVSSQLDIVWCP
jgi:hypothetical protein